MKNSTRENQERIFRELYKKNKGTPMAVSSESLEHKRLRFNNIVSIFETDNEFTVHDIGMGLADMLTFINERYPNKKFKYSGSEILEEYVNESRNKFPDIEFFQRDIAEKLPDDKYDWVVMSGVFHQRRESTIPEWELFSKNLIKNAFQMCQKGIAFNFITPHVDFFQTEVYYSNMPKWINFIVDNLSRFFVIRHDYALYEYTIHVFKEEYIHKKYPQSEFQKYFKK